MLLSEDLLQLCKNAPIKLKKFIRGIMRQISSPSKSMGYLDVEKTFLGAKFLFIAIFIGLSFISIASPVHATEKKSYTDLSSRLFFKGSNRLCTYQISYKGAVLNGGKRTFSSQSSFKLERLSGRRFFVRHASFPLPITDFIKLLRGDEAAFNNKELARLFLNKFINTSNLAELNLQARKLAIVTSSFNRINPLGKKLPKTKIIAGIYLADASQGGLFAMASIKPKIFSINETCGTTPPKLLKSLRH